MERNETETETWGIVASGPALDAHEVEEAGDQIEVVVLWGAQALHVSHIAPDGAFTLGDASVETVDFQMAPETIGATIRPLVEDGFLRVPNGATGTLFIGGQSEPLRDHALTMGVEARVELGEFAFVVRNVRAGKRIADRDIGLERRPFMYVGGVMAIAGAMLAMFSLLPPPGSAMSLDQLDSHSRLANFMIEADAIEEPEELFTAEDEGSNSEQGEAHAGDEGAMGDEAAPPADNRYAIQGEARREDQQMSREAQRDMATTAGVLGVFSSLTQQNGPTSPFGADMAIGADPMAALGHMMGTNIGDASGLGGLGLIGTGRGAGGNGHGTIGVGNWGGIGRTGTCDGENCGTGRYGDSVGHLGGHVSRVPTLTGGVSTINGGLSREVIRREVRRHRNEVKHCYERALQSRPDLEGRVVARFMISPTGAVTVASVANSSLGHSEAEQCIVSAVRRFSFPQPDNGGMVSVSYPFVFASR